MKKIRLAVSGDAGSFSEEAGLLYARRSALDVRLLYAIDMEGVLRALDRGKAELGIFPVVNSRGGLVQTAYEAMGRHLFRFIDQLCLEVHHCLLVKDGVAKSRVRRIATHPQAISQCERHLQREFPRAELIEWEDTAKAARDLAAGRLGSDTAVIAPGRCARIYGLKILARGIQDHRPNLTTFIIVESPKKILAADDAGP